MVCMRSRLLRLSELERPWPVPGSAAAAKSVEEEEEEVEMGRGGGCLVEIMDAIEGMFSASSIRRMILLVRFRHTLPASRVSSTPTRRNLIFRDQTVLTRASMTYG